MRSYLATTEHIAQEAHAGQLYGKRDYIEAHVRPVVGMIARMGYGEAYQAVGWLHDVFEDSNITPQAVLERGAPLRVVTAAELLDKRGQSHQRYLGRIATEPLAIVAKFADSSLNFANTIIASDELDPARYQRRIREYAHNIAFLEPLLPRL